MASNLKGLDQVNRNLNRELKKIRGRTAEGLLDAGIFIRREMDTTFPKIPIDTNTLRASWFMHPFRVGMNPVLLIGFTANYAPFVHEMVDRGDINWNRPDSGPKFLEAHLDNNHTAILMIIGNKAKID